MAAAHSPRRRSSAAAERSAGAASGASAHVLQQRAARSPWSRPVTSTTSTRVRRTTRSATRSRTPRSGRCYAYKPDSVTPVPDLAAGHAEGLERRQDRHRPASGTACVQPARQPRGHLRRREVRDRARLRDERRERLRRRVLRRSRRCARRRRTKACPTSRHPDAEQVHDRVQAEEADAASSSARSRSRSRPRCRPSTRGSSTTRRPRPTACTRSRRART